MKVESFKIKGWKDLITGLIIDENDKWILIQYIPSDYAIDGYKLLRKKYVKKRISKTREKQIKRVLKLKNIKVQTPKKFKFRSVIETLKWSEKKYGLFEFQDYAENELFYGKINHTKGNILVIDFIRKMGEKIKKFNADFHLNKIQIITFESDYFESICLLRKDTVRQNKSKQKEQN